jgi:hypothetical protein
LAQGHQLQAEGHRAGGSRGGGRISGRGWTAARGATAAVALGEVDIDDPAFRAAQPIPR